jgi:hypothetical protein
LIAVRDSAGGSGGGGGLGIQTQAGGVLIPSPRSSYRPVEYSTTLGCGGAAMNVVIDAAAGGRVYTSGGS